MAGNGYSKTKKGPRADLGGLRVRSSWEANICRVHKYLQEHHRIVHWEYEDITFKFPGKDEKARGTSLYTPDIHTICFGDIVDILSFGTSRWSGGEGFWDGYLEPKGRLKYGGWLIQGETLLDLSGLDKAGDSASRIKLERMMRHYPMVAPRIFVIGQREYAAITKQWKSLIPEWE